MICRRFLSVTDLFYQKLDAVFVYNFTGRHSTPVVSWHLPC